ncbi:macro domain-like protein [Laetiporus sulphureus 93-53]|uniref:Macro domain-like protein n=1 Tax=Laetiporus sulphureus 93-53 TaxID=1314785 RepID=A0A165DTB5_9APHY|nr:macro domain-like protein [Laetiporus sulphureus 93-53]KZT05589.1 macro domain-like protein [Laetiporus sulphureus 93-53]
MDVRFTLLDLSAALIEEWQRAFNQHLPNAVPDRITLVQAMLADLKPPLSQFDCIVSPANSYGRLDGGFDYFLSEAIAPADDLLAPTRLVQATLYRRWRGYAPPGTCTLVSLSGSTCENNSHACAYIAICPTMRIPEVVLWNREVVYNCVWSLLVAVDEHNRSVKATGAGTEIRRVLMTGLATGVGCVSAERCAQQMALAMKHFEDASLNADKWSALGWDDAIRYTEESRATHRF